jgi:hypothetical protein
MMCRKPAIGPHHHLALAQGHTRHHGPALAWSVGAVHIAAQQNVAADALHVAGEPPGGGGEHEQKDDRRKAHGVVFGG